VKIINEAACSGRQHKASLSARECRAYSKDLDQNLPTPLAVPVAPGSDRPKQQEGQPSNLATHTSRTTKINLDTSKFVAAHTTSVNRPASITSKQLDMESQSSLLELEQTHNSQKRGKPMEMGTQPNKHTLGKAYMNLIIPWLSESLCPWALAACLLGATPKLFRPRLPGLGHRGPSNQSQA